MKRNPRWPALVLLSAAPIRDRDGEVLAAVLAILRAGGAELGWGFQLQSPLVIAALILVMLGHLDAA